MLEKLVRNSQQAIEDGTYDIAQDLSALRSKDSLDEKMRVDLHPTLICEIKFASPSLGSIRSPGDAAGIAAQMVSGGASAISVLTQPHMFGGSPEYFAQARKAVSVPMLMKDIVIGEEQVDAAARLGADYVLLIQAVFDSGLASGMGALLERAHKLGLKVLAEAHTGAELGSALRSGADLVGINNRSLETLEVDTGLTGRLLGAAQAQRPVVSESGIGGAQDVLRLRKAGARGYLVGSSVMKSADIRGAVAKMAGAY